MAGVQRGTALGHECNSRCDDYACYTGGDGLPEPEISREAAIATIEESRRTHIEWLAYWEAITPHGECHWCADRASLVGDADHHRKCIAEYDNVLAVLRSIARPYGDT